ncbi:MAG: helix-turn-helix domain-containing protein [Hyphomicrobiaceae bacterium]
MSEDGVPGDKGVSDATEEAMDIDALVGSRLKLRRKVLGMTQTELAERCGLSGQQVHKYEQGTNSMNAARLARAAEVLAVPIGWFFDEIEFSAELPDDLLDILSDPQNTKMISLFSEIDDSGIKAIIINLVKDLADYKKKDRSDTVRHELLPQVKFENRDS